MHFGVDFLPSPCIIDSTKSEMTARFHKFYGMKLMKKRVAIMSCGSEPGRWEPAQQTIVKRTSEATA